MKDEIMRGVIWMTTDGIKDAGMAYDYAVSMHGQVDGVTEELIEVHKQAYRELLDKVMKFNA